MEPDGGPEPQIPVPKNEIVESRNTDDDQPDERRTRPNSEPDATLKTIPKENKSVVFNYSNVKLTNPMERLFNRGLNFSVLPLKLDTTQVFVDFKKFQRSVIWHEFWYGREQQIDVKKTNFQTSEKQFAKKLLCS